MEQQLLVLQQPALQPIALQQQLLLQVFLQQHHYQEIIYFLVKTTPH